tara:strand:+ start:241 stop:480 length:240 start_codon:yes stop_codon:yes gene_type:complete
MNTLFDDPMDHLRSNRNVFLKESDWTQMPDSSLSDAEKAKWATYRQELRDLPMSSPNPRYDMENTSNCLVDITWPTKPE